MYGEAGRDAEDRRCAAAVQNSLPPGKMGGGGEEGRAEGRGKEMERTRAERKRVKQGDVFLNPVRSDGRGRGVRVKDKGKVYPLQFLKFLLNTPPTPTHRRYTESTGRS